MIVVTGASGHLGKLVIENLLRTQKPNQIVASVRNPEKAQDLEKLGVIVRHADYERPETLQTAFKGSTKILLISSSEIGRRVEQHHNVIQAAKALQIQDFVYTSILKADQSPLGLAKEHLLTEELILKSGLHYTFLRNGWYLENHTEHLSSVLEHGVFLGAAKMGRFSSASRADYAAAAASVLAESHHRNRVYELAGDSSFSLSQLADNVGKVAGKTVVYKDMEFADYEKALVGFGLPGPFAQLLADSDAGAALGGLESYSKDLSSIIKRPTTTLEEALKLAIK